MESFYTDYGAVAPELQRDLDRLKTAGIPVDVIFEQGGDGEGAMAGGGA